MSKTQRIVAIIMTAVILFISLSFVVYSAHNINHECAGESCSICAQIDMCKNLIKTLYISVITVFIASVTHKLSRQVMKSTKRIIYSSPVITKVKLLN